MKERVTVMVLVMVVYMMVMMVVRVILFVEATTARSLATIIMKRMIAVSSLRELNLKLLLVLLVAGVYGWSLVPAFGGLMVTVRKPDIDIVLITVVDTLNNHNTEYVVLFVPIMLILVRNNMTI